MNKINLCTLLLATSLASNLVAGGFQQRYGANGYITNLPLYFKRHYYDTVKTAEPNCTDCSTKGYVVVQGNSKIQAAIEKKNRKIERQLAKKQKANNLITDLEQEKAALQQELGEVDQNS